MKLSKYIEQIKTELEIESNYGVAKELNIDRRKLNFYIRGERTSDIYTRLKIAETLHLDPLKVILDLEIEDTKNEEEIIYMKNKVKLKKSADERRKTSVDSPNTIQERRQI